MDFLIGRKVLAEKESQVNGKLTVVRDLAWGTHIISGKITQSGGVARTVWKTALKKVDRERPKVKSCLILGLGGGTIATLAKQLWPNIKIVGVDIDPVMIKLGQKYLDFDTENVTIVIADAYHFCTDFKSEPHADDTYDLICVDTYIGDEYPKKLENRKFVSSVCGKLAKGGIVCFNRLYYGEKRRGADQFEEQLRGVFSKVEPVRPEANIIYFCEA